jgi:hypothetical protein
MDARWIWQSLLGGAMDTLIMTLWVGFAAGLVWLVGARPW